MDINKFFQLYFTFWFLSIPITIYLLYTLVIEILDLLFNSFLINNLLKKSDCLNIDSYEKSYLNDKERQLKSNKSNLLELERQIEYQKYFVNTEVKYPIKSGIEKDKIKAAKEISDLFKIKLK